MITFDELKEMQERCDKATSGPWKSYIEGRDHTSGSSFIMTSNNDIELSGSTDADQDFMAHARQDMPKLIAEIKRLLTVRRNVAMQVTNLHQPKAGSGHKAFYLGT